jgi:RND superfamily putative drug exporter
VVRSVLVTALNLDLGRWNWWPSKLARQPATETDITAEPAAVGG